MQQTRFLLHTADLHIGSNSGSYSRSKEYKAVFDNLGKWIAEFPHKDQLAIVIAGDIFHHKIRYSGDDVDDFNYLLDIVQDIPIIIIPGNHDAALNDHTKLDLISPLISGRKNVHYWRTSGWYSLNNVNFYHLSVFDDSSVSQIETLVKSTPSFADTILLYHGMFNGAAFGRHTVSDSRITKTVIDSVKLLIAGDIHQQQFVTPTAAYCGSLIQQNLGESPNKGFLLWDLNTPSGTFIPVNNPSAFVRVDLRGLSTDAWKTEIALITTPESVLKVSLLTDVEDSQYDDQRIAIEERFGRLDRVSRQVQTLVINPVDDITEAIYEMLIAKEVDDDLAVDIITDYASKMHSFATNKWTVTRMSWNNLFKYGSGNILDFAKLEGVTGVIAPNRAGKSSIIDILVFGLFGEHLRGDRKSIIRYGAKEAMVRVDFKVSGIEYYVERIIQKSDNSAIKLYKFANDVWINITGVTVDVTYKTVRQLIGTLNQFLSTSLYYDPSTDIIKQSKSDRIKSIPELFGMTDNESILRGVRTTLRSIKEKIDKLIRPRLTNPQDDHDNLSNQIVLANESKERLVQIQSELNAKIAHLENKINNSRSIYAVTQDITNVTNLLRELTDKRDRIVIDVEIPYISPEHMITLTPVELSRFTDMVNNYNAKDAPYYADVITTISASIDSNYAEEPSRQTKEVGLLRKELQTAQSALEICNITLSKFREPMMYNKTISEITKELSQLQLQDVNDKLIASISGDIETAKAKSQLKFSIKCDCCNNNKIVLDNELLRKENYLSDEVKKREISILHNVKVSENIRSLNELRDEILANDKLISNISSCKKDIESLTLKISLLTSKISTLDEYIAKYASQQIAIDQLSAAKESFKRATEVDRARDKLSCSYRYNQHQLLSRRELLNDEIFNNENHLAGLKLEMANSHSLEDISNLSELSTRIKASNIGVSTADKNIGVLSNQLTTIAGEIIILNEYNTQYPALYAQYTAKKTFAECLSSPELKMTVIKKSMSKVITMANELLLSITDFTIQSDITDKSIEFFLTESNNPKLPIGLASGFQKFIVSTVLRISLTSFIPSGSQFMIIDEGFGCMDESNIDKLPELFTQLSTQFDFLFIISHITNLQNILNNPVNIINKHDHKLKLLTRADHMCSHINNTYDAANPLTAQKEIEEREILDSLAHIKAVADQSIAPVIVPIAEDNPADAPNNQIPIGSVQCNCGEIVKKRSLQDHLKTAKHRKKLEAKVVQNANIH